MIEEPDGRRRAEVVEHEVAVGDRIDRVLCHGSEAEVAGEQVAVGVEVHAGQRPGPQRQPVGLSNREAKPGTVPREHPEIREQVV